MTKPQKLRGIYPILATPFKSQGELDLRSFERLLDFLGGTKVQGLTLFGLAGEYYKLADDERQALQNIFLRKTPTHVTRIVSITDHSLEVARRRARAAVDAGAEALMIMPPFFLSPDPQSVRMHMEAIAEAVSTPILIQYSPNQTGLPLPPSFFIDLACQYPQIEYVKIDSTPSGPVISALRDASQGRLDCFVGYAGLQIVDAFMRGAVGCMPGCSLPEPYREVYQALRKNDPEEAARLHELFLPVISFMMQSLEFIIQCEKVILFWRGLIDSSYCRHPATALGSDDTRFLRESLARLAILGTKFVR